MHLGAIPLKQGYYLLIYNALRQEYFFKGKIRKNGEERGNAGYFRVFL